VYLLATPPRLVTQRRVPGRLGSPVGKTRSAAAHRLGRGDRRRLVFTGKKGGDEVGRCHKGNGTRILLLIDANDTPLSSYITAAQHSEVHTIETLVDERRLRRLPRRLLYDKGGRCGLAA
jgi:aerobic-type carbon monoxide dehydrogenase small subunit (CoxS/CutS family)